MALALTGAVAGVMFLPLGQAVAGASTGFPAVEAGGPPPQPAKAAPRPAPRAKPRVVTRVRKEKPVIVMPPRHRHHRHHRNIEAFIENDNFNRGHKHDRHQRRDKHDFHRHYFNTMPPEIEDELEPEGDVEMNDGLN
ncbi:hypothetical protein ACIBP6_40320 [Nonomuraea terrae]|uniref:hypothetical protein n=1 Tax=Nonomuraea terrae TaxID=2530383 RepID=UPI0037AB82CB